MAIHGDVQRDLTLGRVRFHQLQGLLDERDEVGCFELILFASLADAREIEDVFDQRSEPATFLDNQAKIIGLLLRVGNLAAIEAFGHESHGGNRRAEFVRDAGDEVGFHLGEALLSIKRAPGCDQASQGGARGYADEQAEPRCPNTLARKEGRGIGQISIDPEQSVRRLRLSSRRQESR